MKRNLILAEWKRAVESLRAAESHAAVRRLFGLHFVQTGSIEPDWGTYLGESSDLRLAADYDVETPLFETDAHEECDRARAFLVRIRQLLLENGLTSQELRAGVLNG